MVDPKFPDVITLEISLLSTTSKIPSAIQMLQQHNISVKLVSKSTYRESSIVLPTQSSDSCSKAMVAKSSSSSVADLKTKVSPEEKPNESNNEGSNNGISAGVTSIVNSTLDCYSISPTTVDRPQSSVSCSRVQEETCSTAFSESNPNNAISTTKDTIRSSKSSIEILNSEVISFSPVTEQCCNNLYLSNDPTKVPVSFHCDSYIKMFVQENFPLQETVENSTTFQDNFKCYNSIPLSSLCVEDVFSTVVPKPSELLENNLRHTDINNKRVHSDHSSREFTDDTLWQTTVQKSHASVAAKKFKGSNLDEDFIDSHQHSAFTTTIVDEQKLLDLPLSSTWKDQNRSDTNSANTVEDCAKECSSSVIEIDSSDGSTAGDDNSSVAVVEALGSSDFKQMKTKFDQSEKAYDVNIQGEKVCSLIEIGSSSGSTAGDNNSSVAVVEALGGSDFKQMKTKFDQSEKAYDVNTQGEEVCIIIDEEESADGNACSTFSNKNTSLSMVSGSQCIAESSKRLQVNSCAAGVCSVSESCSIPIARSAEPLQLLSSIKTFVSSEQDLKPDVNALQPALSNSQPGPLVSDSVDESKVDVKPLKILSIDCKRGISAEPTCGVIASDAAPHSVQGSISIPILRDIKPSDDQLHGQASSADLNKQFANGVTSNQADLPGNDSDDERTSDIDDKMPPPMVRSPSCRVLKECLEIVK